MVFKRKCIAFIDSEDKPGTCDHYRKSGICRFLLKNGKSAHCDDTEKDPIIEIKVRKVSVLIKSGTDSVSIFPEWETPFPDMGYPPVLTMEVKKGYGIEYCRRVIGIEPEVIETI